MKKIIISLLVLFTIFVNVPISAFGEDYEVTQKGDAISGQEYSGTMVLNRGGNPIPVRYNLNVPKNSIIHVFLYTQKESDSNFYINSTENPYFIESGGGSSFRGAALTTFGDFYKPQGEVFGSSRFGVSADKRNTREYTEMFGHLSKGNYFIELNGYSYHFKFYVEPLKYNDDYTGGTTEDVQHAANYIIGNDQEGNMIENGPTNELFPRNNYDWYKFDVKNPGKYTIDFSNDGFLKANVSVLDASGYSFADTQNTTIDTTIKGSTTEVLATYEEHISEARSYSRTFDIQKAGTYTVRIARGGWTDGSYKFNIHSVNSGTGTTGGTTTDTTDNLDESEAVLKSVAITPQNPSVKVNGKLQLAAEATYTNGDKDIVTDFINWTSANKNVATVDENGVVSGVASGATDIIATLEGQKFSIRITVTGAVIKKIIPLRPVVYTRIGSQPTNPISGIFSDNTKKNITKEVMLYSSNSNVLIYKNYMLKAMKKGTTTITVNYKGIKVTYKVIIK